MSRYEPPRNQVLVGDASRRLAELPEQSVNCVITSPPYFNLRNYGVDGQIGLEEHVDEWVEELRVVMRGVARVLRTDGVVWLNLGDSYARHPKQGANRKSLLLGPERVALKLIEDGWVFRNRVAWVKSNTLPNSTKDRLSSRWEFVYMLTRSERYWFDLDPIRVPLRSKPTKPRAVGNDYPPTTAQPPQWSGPLAGNNGGLARLKAMGLVGHRLGANPRDAWLLPASNFRGPHFATFPLALVERPLLSSCPEKVCARCGAPWLRGPMRERGGLAVIGKLQRACRCRAGVKAGLVLDPFFGAGTVGLAAEQHSRDWLGIELNPAFARLATERIAAARQQSGEGERHAA